MSDQLYSPNADPSGFTAGFLLGLILGGAGGYLLSTEKGQELLVSLKENAGDKIKELAENPAIADKLADLEKTMAEAQSILKNTQTDAREKVHEVAARVAESTASRPAPKKNFFHRMGAKLGK